LGRTVPSFRIAESLEVESWKPFRRALPKGERPLFDEMTDGARLYTSASSFAVRTSRFEGLMMAVLFHHHKELTASSESLAAMRESLKKKG
jgi:hypothetical protein